MNAGTNDKVTKAVIQIFSDRGLSAKTIDLFAAIDDIVNLVGKEIDNTISRQANPGKYVQDNVETAIIPRIGNHD